MFGESYRTATVRESVLQILSTTHRVFNALFTYYSLLGN